MAVNTVFFVVLLAEAAVAIAAPAIGGEAIDDDPAGDGVVGGATNPFPTPTALVVVSADCGMAIRSPTALASAAADTGMTGGCGRSAFRFRAEEEVGT